MTSQWARWRLKSTAFWWFPQSFVQAQIKENIKAPRHWPLRGEFTGHRWNPSQRASNAENVSIWWRHHSFVVSGFVVVTPSVDGVFMWRTHFHLRKSISFIRADLFTPCVTWTPRNHKMSSWASCYVFVLTLVPLIHCTTWHRLKLSYVLNPLRTDTTVNRSTAFKENTIYGVEEVRP